METSEMLSDFHCPLIHDSVSHCCVSGRQVYVDQTYMMFLYCVHLDLGDGLPDFVNYYNFYKSKGNVLFLLLLCCDDLHLHKIVQNYK